MPQPQAAAEQPFKPSAPPRGHCQRPQLVKGKSPQGPRATVQIEKYLLRSAAQLASCSSSAATASRLTSRMLPHVSLDASQLLKPALTTPRSCVRRHPSWRTLPAPTAPTLHLSSTILRKASRSTTEEEDSEYFSTISGCFVLECQCFVARIYCDGQDFY